MARGKKKSFRWKYCKECGRPFCSTSKYTVYCQECILKHRQYANVGNSAVVNISQEDFEKGEHGQF